MEIGRCEERFATDGMERTRAGAYRERSFHELRQCVEKVDHPVLIAHKDAQGRRRRTYPVWRRDVYGVQRYEPTSPSPLYEVSHRRRGGDRSHTARCGNTISTTSMRPVWQTGQTSALGVVGVLSPMGANAWVIERHAPTDGRSS